MFNSYSIYMFPSRNCTVSFPEMSPANSSTKNSLSELWRSKLVVMSLNLSVESPKSQKAYNFIANLMVISWIMPHSNYLQSPEKTKCSVRRRDPSVYYLISVK